MKKLTTFSKIIIPSVLFLLIAAGISISGKGVGAAQNPASALGVQEYARPVAAGDFTLIDHLGRRVSLKGFRGKTVMLNFWATWCGPCQEEMPSMEHLHQKFKDRGLVVLAVAAGEEHQDVKAFMEDFHLTFPALADPKDEVSQAYNVWSIPVTYFINSKGELIGKVQGSRQWDDEEAFQYVSSLLKKQ